MQLARKKKEVAKLKSTSNEPPHAYPCKGITAVNKSSCDEHLQANKMVIMTVVVLFRGWYHTMFPCVASANSQLKLSCFTHLKARILGVPNYASRLTESEVAMSLLPSGFSTFHLAFPSI